MEHIHKTLKEKKEECIKLLLSTNRPGIQRLIDHITKMGYFIAPASYKHHRFYGGLVSHSLETYYKAIKYREEKLEEGFSLDSMPDESIIISALMHDLCKADTLRFNKEYRRVDSIKHVKGHSERSVRKVLESNFHLTTDEENAILWHMGGKHRGLDEVQRLEFFENNPLCDIIHRADSDSIDDAKKRHHNNNDKGTTTNIP